MSFSKCPDSDANVSRDPFPKLTEFNMDDYVILVAHPALFQKFPEPFLCLVGMICNYTLDEDTYPSFLHDDGTDMDLFAFIQVADPTKVKVVERERDKGKQYFGGKCGKLFDEGGSTKQGDSAAGSGHDGASLRILDAAVKDTVAGNVTAERPRRQRKKRRAVTDASGSSHPPKKLKGDHGTFSEAATGGKSPYVLKELLARSSFLNVKAGIEVVATLPLVTFSVFAMFEWESGAPTDYVTGLNLRTICQSERFVISSNSSHLSSTNAAEAGIDSFVKSVAPPPVMTEAVITTNVAIIDHLAPPILFARIREMDYHHLFMEFNVGTARQACLNAKVRIRTEYYLSERKRLESKCESQADLLKAKDVEIENLKAQVLLKEAEAAEAARLRIQVSAAESTKKIHADEIDALKQRNVALENEKDSLAGKVIKLQSSVSAKDLELKDLNVAMSSLRSQKDGLVDQVHALETTCSNLRDQVSGYERLKEQVEEFQDAQMNIVNDKVAKLDADLLEMALHLEEKFYPHLLTTISGWRWLLTHDLKLAIVKCLNSQEYLSALGAAISRAIEKGMQDGLSVGIVHGKEGRSLADVAAYNHADASVEDIMNLLRLEGPLVDAPGMSDLQPNVDQLMLHVHQSKNQVVLAETSLSFALNVTHSWVERIRENVAAQRSAFICVWAPLVDPLSAKNLVGTAGTSESVPATVATTTALSTTFASASSVPPITIEDYEVVGTDGPEDAQGNVVFSPQLNLKRRSWILLRNVTRLAELILSCPPTAKSAWMRCLHFMNIAFLKIADIPCSRKLLSIT
ncbi:hypothetical protein Tco_0888864 [Tanacetum coccineum]